MTTNFPGALDSTGSTLPDNKADATVTATDHKTHHNNLADAVIAIETVFGTNPHGLYTDVKTRLNAAIYNGAGSQTIQPSSDVVALIVKAFGGTANIQDWRLSNNSIVAFVDHTGLLSAAALSISGTPLNSTHLSDTASVARLASPAFTGSPTAPTPTTGDNSTKIATTAFVAVNGGAPTGAIIAFAAGSAPTGWAICDGSSVLRAGTYAALFAVIGTTYGSVDGTHFTLPDLRGRMVAGVGTNAAVSSLGLNEGVSVANRRPQHRHTPHAHTIQDDERGSGGDSAVMTGPTYTDQHDFGYVDAADGGSGNPADPLDGPAFIALTYIIKL